METGAIGSVGAGAASVAAVAMSEWESSKENVLPLKGGRDPHALAEAVAVSSTPLSQQKARLDEQRRSVLLLHLSLSSWLCLKWALCFSRFSLLSLFLHRAFEEELVAKAKGDVLDVWRRYVAWAQQSFSSDASKTEVVPLLERCTTALADDPRYANDLRFLKLWITYADLRGGNALEVFILLRNRGIGQSHALFFEALAACHEQAARYQDATKAYNEVCRPLPHLAFCLPHPLYSNSFGLFSKNTLTNRALQKMRRQWTD